MKKDGEERKRKRGSGVYIRSQEAEVIEGSHGRKKNRTQGTKAWKLNKMKM